MTNLQAWIRTACLVALTAGCFWGGMGLSRIGYTALENWSKAAPNIQPTLDAANSTLAVINAPCTGFHGSVTCGPLAQLSQAEKNVGILAGQSALQVRQTGTLVTAVAQNLDTVGESVKETAGHLDKTLDAGTDLTVQATATLKTVNDKAGPLLAAYTQSGVDLDALLKSHALTDTLDNAAGTSRNVQDITADFARVTDKASADYLAPKPWYKKVGRFAGDALDYGAFVARHF